MAACSLLIGHQMEFPLTKTKLYFFYHFPQKTSFFIQKICSHQLAKKWPHVPSPNETEKMFPHQLAMKCPVVPTASHSRLLLPDTSPWGTSVRSCCNASPNWGDAMQRFHFYLFYLNIGGFNLRINPTGGWCFRRLANLSTNFHVKCTFSVINRRHVIQRSDISLPRG